MKIKIVSGLLLTMLLAGTWTLIFNIQSVGTRITSNSYTPHVPIRILSDDDFTPANGVVSGIGTASDPYVISGWSITEAWSEGIRVTGTSKHFCIRDNFISYTSEEGILVRDIDDETCEILDNTIEYASEDAIAVHNADGVHIDGNSAQYSMKSGILVDWSDHNNIIRNICNHNNLELTMLLAGIYVDHSSDNTIHGNTANHNAPSGVGIFLVRDSNFNVVSNNTILNNSRGILMTANAHGNIIVNNNIKDNEGDGVELWETSQNTISDNMVTNNALGIWLYDCSDNTLSGNTMAYNEDGVVVVGDSTGNYIHHNNFLTNEDQVWQNGLNYWNDSSGGNYWSDYEGIDEDGDGIGDTETPHHKDYRPFIVPLGPIPVFHKETKYDCIIDGNMTVSRFSMDKNKTIGFNINGQGCVNLTIPRKMLDGSFQIFINNTQIPYEALWDTDHNFIYLEHATSTPVNVKLEAQMKLQGDLNGDGKIDIRDIALVAKHYGEEFQDP